MRLYFLISFILINSNLFSQTIISGRITTQNDQPIAGVNIIITKSDQIIIVAFAISDNEGLYKINYTGAWDSILIKITTIGFATIIHPIINKTQKLDFTLIPKATELPTVEVKSKPIMVQGDTTNYNVASFATKQDRVIGDVIAKLPGIEVDASGAIKYNGKAISNFYINGLDLFESKYSIANNNIPYDLVDKVQVLDNHQPIKVLDTLKNSTSPAINIELKKKARNKFIGRIKIGIGYSPVLSDDEIIAMQFNKGFQFISAYKYNNTGLSLVNEITERVTIRDNNESKQENEKEDIVSLISFPAPPIQEYRYNFNKTHLFHMSALKVLKNTAQVKFNIGYVNDYNKNIGSNTTTLFLPGDTTTISENQKKNSNTNKLNGDFYYTLNKRNKYIKNATKVQIDFNSASEIIENIKKVYENIDNPFYQVTNNFLLLTPIKKKLVSFKSITIFNKTSQNLGVEPGQFAEIFNQSLPFAQIKQSAVLNKLSSNNSIGLFTKLGKIDYEVNIGAEYLYKQLISSMLKINNQINYFLNDSFQNKLNWQNIRLYGNTSSIYKIAKKQVTVSLPIELNNLFVINKINNLSTKKSYLFFNPNINLLIPFAFYYTAEITFSHRNTLGNFTQATPGFILNNYRSISRNDTLLPVQKNNNVLVSASFKNPLRGLFCNISLSYSNINNNIVYSQSYTGLFSQRKAILLPNTQKSFIFSSRVNKYFSHGKTNVTLFYNYLWNQLLQIQQNNLVDNFSKTKILTAKINFDKFIFMSLEGNSIFKIFTNTAEPTNKTSSSFSIFQFEQNLKISFFITNKTTLYFNSEYYKLGDKQSLNNNYYFSDIGMKSAFKKIDWELNCNNITNNTLYTSVLLFNNLKQITQTQIRARTLIVKVFFKF